MGGRRPACALFLGLTVLAAAGQARAGDDPRAEARRRFQDARFGLFLPWGVFSLLGKGAWVMEQDSLPVSEYEKLPPQFDPDGFDAEAWVKTAKAAGAKYLTVTAKHHDGFCMFESRLTGYDVVDATPFARDPLKALADACRRHGVSLVFYYSLLDWHHPDYAPRGRTGKSAGRDGRGDWSKYVAYYQGQVRELCTNYGPIGGVWLDGAWDKPGADWDLDSTYALIHSLQPLALVANNHRDAPRPGEDVQTFRRPSPGGRADDAETASEVQQSLNTSWGYRASDRAYKSTFEEIRLLVGAAAGGSNLLLAVGPKPDGTLPAEALDRLAGVGAWLERHGESVYGTRPGPVPVQDWGVSTQDGGPGKETVYLHVLQPGREIRLPETPRPFDARPLGSDTILKQERDGSQVVVKLPEPDRTVADTVIVLTPREPDAGTGGRR